MDKWRKSNSTKTTRPAKAASSTSTRRTAKEETTMLLNLKRQMNKESSNMGSMWRPRVPSAKKSIPRRLSYSKHDDSLSLMNIGSRLDDPMKSTPVCLETASSLDISKYGGTKKKEFDDDEELGVKKDTLEYLKSIGVIGNSDCKWKNKAPTVTAKKLPSAKKAKTESPAKKQTLKQRNNENNVCLIQTNVDNSKETFSQLDQEKENIPNANIPNANVKESQNGIDLTSLLPKVRELLVKQSKQKSELRERYETDMRNMEKSHEEELIGLFNPPEKIHTTEPVALDAPTISVTENSISQEILILEDSFLKSPYSGTWRVSHLGDDDDSFSNNTPTLCLNSLSNVTINGQQFLETPATRRLVTQRILQGIENLFVQ